MADYGYHYLHTKPVGTYKSLCLKRSPYLETDAAKTVLYTTEQEAARTLLHLLETDTVAVILHQDLTAIQLVLQEEFSAWRERHFFEEVPLTYEPKQDRTLHGYAHIHHIYKRELYEQSTFVYIQGPVHYTALRVVQTY